MVALLARAAASSDDTLSGTILAIVGEISAYSAKASLGNLSNRAAMRSPTSKPSRAGSLSPISLTMPQQSPPGIYGKDGTPFNSLHFPLRTLTSPGARATAYVWTSIFPLGTRDGLGIMSTDKFS
eukprot:898109_1